jgi:hypothetical protein
MSTEKAYETLCREVEEAHRALDDLGAPRKIDHESPCDCTLATRIFLIPDGPLGQSWLSQTSRPPGGSA